MNKIHYNRDLAIKAVEFALQLPETRAAGLAAGLKYVQQIYMFISGQHEIFCEKAKDDSDTPCWEDHVLIQVLTKDENILTKEEEDKINNVMKDILGDVHDRYMKRK